MSIPLVSISSHYQWLSSAKIAKRFLPLLLFLEKRDVRELNEDTVAWQAQLVPAPRRMLQPHDKQNSSLHQGACSSSDQFLELLRGMASHGVVCWPRIEVTLRTCHWVYIRPAALMPNMLQLQLDHTCELGRSVLLRLLQCEAKHLLDGFLYKVSRDARFPTSNRIHTRDLYQFAIDRALWHC